MRLREERRLAGGDRGAAAPLTPPRSPSPTPTAAAAAKRQPAKRGSAKRPPVAVESKNHLKREALATQAVEAAEAALAVVEAELSDPAAWATKYEAAKSEARHTAATRAVEAAYAQLEALL